jgi:hypothetical protein
MDTMAWTELILIVGFAIIVTYLDNATWHK